MDTLADVLARDEHDGYTGQFRAVAAGQVQCLTCRGVFSALTVQIERLDRLEGASDPADMIAVVALRCPHCETRGTAVLNYGPEAEQNDDADVLVDLEDDRPEFR
jgi:hypothetical protein